MCVMVVEQHWTTNIQFSLISCTLTCLYPEIFLEHRLHLSQAPKSSATDRLHQPYRQHDWIRRCLRRWCSHERWQTWSNPLEQLGVRQFEVIPPNPKTVLVILMHHDIWRCMIQPWHHELPLWSSNLAMAKSSDCTGSNSNLLVETWGFPIASFDSQRVQVNPDFHGLDPNCWFWKQTMDGWTDRQTDRSITSTPTHPQALTECTTEAYTMVSGVMPPVGPCVERRFC